MIHTSMKTKNLTVKSFASTIIGDKGNQIAILSAERKVRSRINSNCYWRKFE
jgi:hypothetical protein